MFNSSSKLLIIGLMTVGLGACSKYEFSQVPGNSSQFVDEPITMPGYDLTELSAKTLSLNGSPTMSYNQVNNTRNRTTINFQALDGSGDFINDLTSGKVVLTENGLPISNFTLSSNAQQVKPTTDIVFLIDVTCSMSPTINSAKSAVINFINSSRANGYHTRMCLSTFGDYTVQKCSRFYDNDPANPATETQVSELISAVTRLSAGCGAADPGGSDLAENPLRAIMDAESAPYAQGSQRFGILVTDASFLYAPGKPGSLGASAPVYADTLASIGRSGLNLFVAAPTAPGYNEMFGTQASLVAASNGEYFPYADVVAGRTTMATILNRIILRVQTTYTIEYTVDEIPGLDSSLPLSERTIQIRPSPTAPNGTVIRTIGVDSSMPNGAQPLVKKFKVSDRMISAGSWVVKINGVTVPGGYTITNGELEFALPPVSGAKIEIAYAYANLKDAVQVEPIIIDGREDKSNITIFLNGIKATNADLRFEKTLDGNWLVTLNDSVFANADPFLIRSKSGLRVRVFRTRPL